MIGLKRNTVQLISHQIEWDIEANKTIDILKNILKESALDIQHVGSTSISTICAKPIIDIAVGMRNVDDLLQYIPELEKKGIIFRGSDHPGQYLLIIGNLEDNFISHHIHVCEYDSIEWNHYINFRDYLNTYQEEAKRYEQLKIELVQQYSQDRKAYTSGKMELIHEILNKAEKWRKEK